ncbi:tetraacyldisaccharide 4'-kinase [Thiohalobacter sp.]|uniref:tetraacyldisaccharide 4'-kinase n=1 Tax=Thiohalobacter sp. TaxID=2025948 RepID=UPI002634A61E|nr:tetraacyldisaccharide 4'-kinase [Thiohalobacter sp.]
MALAERLQRLWYGRSPAALWLLPLAWLFCALVTVRRRLYRRGLLRVQRLPVPVIVVGNITVGGTGKTPLVAWLARRLREAGFRPGLIARGHGGGARTWPQQVRGDSDPRVVGDEPVLLARLTGCPMAVGPDRVEAARQLLAHSDCDILLSDDGLQHYRLGRDLEIAVLDGVRRLGNGFCLPAGPLREPAARLREVDFVVTQGLAGRGEYRLKLRPVALVSLVDPARRESLEAWRGRRVHALAGIGHPQRFFELLRRSGLEVVEYPFPDHHPFTQEDRADVADGDPVVMTAKDAVKWARFAGEGDWYLEVEAEVDERLWPLLEKRLR